MLQDRNVSSGRVRSRATHAAVSSLRAAERHAVQFYDSDRFLIRVVARFLINGLSRGEAAIAVATSQHLSALVDHLRAKQIDVDAYRAEGLLLLHDANELLPSIMRLGMPSEEHFQTALDAIWDAISPSAQTRRVHVYGEMVDILWQNDNAAAAIRLEELWDGQIAAHDISLLCTYALHGFRGAKDSEAIADICRHHGRVTPTERFVRQTRSARRTQVVLLQQRAQALEAELDHSRELEARLRRAATAAKRAKASAEMASRARTQFLTVMSHELRTPLNAIGGYAELLGLGIHGPVTDDQLDSLERIQRNQHQLLGLINQVLDYSRLETGGLQYDVREIVVAQAIQKVESLTLAAMNAKRVGYRPSMDPTLLACADRDKLHQILLNLFTNAVKFTNEGGTIEVDSFGDATRVYVSVHDTGVGIADDRLATIFDPFVQVEGGFTRRSGGIGLGLAISRELARGMGGTLTVASAVGQGSTFTLALPRLVR